MDTPELGTPTSVLVVGAGPVGLAAAVALREQGVTVRVIDELPREEKRTYPVLLHPRTLQILDAMGVGAPLEWRGRAIRHLAIFSDGVRRALLDLPSAGRVSPGGMTLPQDVLRQALMNRLSDLGVDVEWRTRLANLEQTADRVTASLARRERIDRDATRLAPEWVDVDSAKLDAEFVIGADGTHSAVRRQLRIGWVPQGSPESYVFYDAPDARAGATAQLVIHESQASTVYPLQGDVSRFAFQVSVAMPHSPGLTQLRQLVSSRMPWYAVDARHFEWSGIHEFRPALAERFGQGRVWLAGDAAHATGPLGGQSLNVGILEAQDLARRIAPQVGRGGAATLGDGYARQRSLQWGALLAAAPRVGRTHDWVKRHLRTLIRAMPAAGDDLDDLLDQLDVRAA